MMMPSCLCIHYGPDPKPRLVVCDRAMGCCSEPPQMRRCTADGEFKETPFPVLAGCFDAQLTHYSGASGERLDERMCFLRVPYRQ